MVALLRCYANIFAWSHEDMPGIDHAIITHQMNIDPSSRPIRQKRRALGPERYAVIEEEIGKLLKANFIEEVYNPDWVANIILLPKMIKDIQRLNGRVGTLKRFVFRATDKCLPFFKQLKGRQIVDWTKECEATFQQLKQYLGSPPLLSKPELGETLLLYLAVSNAAVSSVLIREHEGKQFPVYHVSKALVPAETRYPSLKKLALALVISSRRLWPYF
ncbi:uncharacterized protein LOC131244165 [Magnolia sinica]|uniref:uncharacterized protein LOC131244165 n=1 Tax=Magnolia sinica TaxID=86752 RepID=UPI00265A99C0|nr:uncharacterized protein LOC131244165 [Magnolia sinica]